MGGPQIHALAPETSEHDPIWRLGSLQRWSSSRRPTWLVSLKKKKGKVGIGTYMGGTRQRWRQRLGWRSYKPRNSHGCQQTWGEGEARSRSSLPALRRNQACRHFDLELLASRTETILFCWLSHSICGTSLREPSRTNTSKFPPPVYKLAEQTNRRRWRACECLLRKVMLCGYSKPVT